MSLFNNFLIQINQQLPPIITTASNIEISFDYQCDIVPSTGKIRFLKVTNNQQVFEDVLDVNNINGKEIIYSISFNEPNPFIENTYYKVQIIFYTGGEYYSNYGISKCINSDSFFSNITYETGDYYYNYYTDDEENYLNYYRYQIIDNNNAEKILDSGEQIALSQENKFYNLLNLDINMQFDSFKKLHLYDDSQQYLSYELEDNTQNWNKTFRESDWNDNKKSKYFDNDRLKQLWNNDFFEQTHSIEQASFSIDPSASLNDYNYYGLQLNREKKLKNLLGLDETMIQGYSDIGIGNFNHSNTDTPNNRLDFLLQNYQTQAYYTIFIPIKLFKIQNNNNYTIFNLYNSSQASLQRFRLICFNSTKTLNELNINDFQIVENFNDSQTLNKYFLSIQDTDDYLAIFFYYNPTTGNKNEKTLKEVLKSLKIFQGKLDYYPTSNTIITNKILLDKIPEIHFKDNYTLKVFGKTNLSQKIYEEQDLLKLNVYTPFTPYQIKTKNLINEGCISINLSYLNQDIPTAAYENQQLGQFYLVRADIKHNFENWEKVQKFAINKVLAQTEILNLKDYTVEQGVEYLYGIQQVNQYGIVSDIVKAKDTCIADFDDLFLLDNHAKIKIKFNPKISSFKITKQESKIETLGSKYPYIIRNDKLSYKEFAISGLISFNMDDSEIETFVKSQKNLNNIFTTYENYRSETYADQSVFTDKELAQMIDSTISLSANNFMKEREFKKALLDWLNNNEYKILKTPAEGNYIVQLTNVSLSPNDTLGRMIHTFTATATEILEYNYNNLKNILNNNFINNNLQIQSFTLLQLKNEIDNEVNKKLNKDIFEFQQKKSVLNMMYYEFVFNDNFDILKLTINNFKSSITTIAGLTQQQYEQYSTNELGIDSTQVTFFSVPDNGSYTLNLNSLNYKAILIITDFSINPNFTFEFKIKTNMSNFELIKNIKYNNNSFKINSVKGGKNWGNFYYRTQDSNPKNYQLLNDESDLSLQFNALRSGEYIGTQGRVIYAKNKYRTINEWSSSTLINKQVKPIANAITATTPIVLGLRKIKIYHKEIGKDGEIVATNASGGSLNNQPKSNIATLDIDLKEDKLYKYTYDTRLYYLYIQSNYYRTQLRDDAYLYSFWIGTENILNNSIYNLNNNYLNCRYVLNELETVNNSQIYQPKPQDKYCLEIDNTGVYLIRPDSSNSNLIQRTIVTTENILDYIDFIWIGGGLIAEVEYLQPTLEIEGSN